MVTLATASGQLLICSMGMPSDQPPRRSASPARLWLSGLVDELGDEGLLGPLQLVRRDAASRADRAALRSIACSTLVEVDALCGGGVRRRCEPLSRPLPEYQPPALEATFSSATSFW